MTMKKRNKERKIPFKEPLRRVLDAWTVAGRSDTIASKATNMSNTYMAVTKHDGGWWIGWIEEVPGVNCQERTHEELLRSLKSTLIEALEFNRKEALKSASAGYSEEPITI